MEEDSLPLVKRLQVNKMEYRGNIIHKIPDHLSVLKSFYSLQIAKRLQTEGRSGKFRCRHCYKRFYEGPASYHVEPEKKKSKLARKLLSLTKVPMTKYQKEYVKNNQYIKENRLEITCTFCQKKDLTRLVKPVQAKSNVAPVVKSKKKRKKDKLCGLRQDAVNAAQGSQRNKSQGISGKMKTSTPIHPPVVNHKTIDKRAIKNRKKQMQKVSSLLQQVPKSSKGLSQFLQFLK